MNELAGKDLNGLDRFKARKVAVEKLTELGTLEKEEPYTNNVGFSERADVPIEPRLSEQWFLKYPGVEKARSCVELGSATVSVADSGVLPESSSRAGIPSGGTPNGADGTSALPKMQFHPQRWAKVYDHWMGGLQDWCVSRQLWWGHRIPVWSKWLRVTTNLQVTVDRMLEGAKAFKNFDVDKQARVVNFKTRELIPPDEFSAIKNDPIDEYELQVCTVDEQVIEAIKNKGFQQDPDVLDTWFSSWLWPFATMGWPEQTETLKKFYPTTDLVTAPDIIFFWVARMIMAGYEFMDEMPFKNVYFTGIIRDKQGRKMSKSLGNSPDPLELVGKYGADALRFGTMRSAPLGQDVLFDEKDVELGRNFCNKLWNACRFRQMVGQGAVGVLPADQITSEGQTFRQDAGSTFEVQGEIDPKLLMSDDKWILLKLDAAIREINTAFAEYKFSDATTALYRFFWSEYCDWYVEASKAVLQSGDAAHKANTLAVIDFVLSHTLRLFHPFLPFITEELWHGMGYADDMPENQGGKTIMFAPWPKLLDDDFKIFYGLSERDEKFIEARNEFIAQCRNLRRNANIPANKKVRFIFKPGGKFSLNDVEVLKLLLNAEAIEVDANYQPAKGVLAVRADLGELFLPLEGLIDVEAEKARLKKELGKIESEISRIEQKLANPNFAQKVPPTVLQEHQQRLVEWQNKLEQTQSALDALQG
jgi:valyl-tRNA synthetase